MSKIEVPGKKIKRSFFLNAIFQKLMYEITSECACGITSHLQRRVKCLDCLGGHAIHLMMLLRCSIPHFPISTIGLIPYFPVTYPVMKTISPTVIVVADDTDTDLSPLFIVFWRKNMHFRTLVLNAGTQTIDDLRICRS